MAITHKQMIDAGWELVGDKYIVRKGIKIGRKKLGFWKRLLKKLRGK